MVGRAGGGHAAEQVRVGVLVPARVRVVRARPAGVFRSRTANDYSAQVTLTVGVLIACSLALGIWAAVRTARDQPVITRQLIGSAVIEAGILVQMVLAGVLVGTGHQVADGFTFWGYLVVALLVLPAAAG